MFTFVCATEENMMAFANSLDPNEMQCTCNTSSQCDPSCLKMVTENIYKTRKNPKISGDICRNGRTKGLYNISLVNMYIPIGFFLDANYSSSELAPTYLTLNLISSSNMEKNKFLP